MTSHIQQQLQTPSTSFTNTKTSDSSSINKSATILPPCSSILLSPNESRLRNSFSKSSPQNVSSFFNEPILNDRSISLPSLDSLITSPSVKRSHSINSPNFQKYIDPFTNKIPNTPINKKLPIISSFLQSTPISKSVINSPFIKLNSSINNTSNNNNTLNNKPNHKNIFKSSKKINDDKKSFAFISHSQETFLSKEPDIDNARLARRKRRRTSPTELSILKNEFRNGSTPNKQRRTDIAQMVDMTEKEVQIWFQNRRQALRKAQLQNNSKFEYQVDYDKSLLPSSSTSSVLSSDNENSIDNNDDKENIDPLSNSSSSSNLNMTIKKSNILPPTGLFQSSSKLILKDITNQQHAYRFKTAKFTSPLGISKRQKPTMKLKLKTGISNNLNLNSCMNILSNSKNV